MPGVKGNKGGSRGTAKSEQEKYQELDGLWSDIQNLEALTNKFKTKKFSAKDRFVYRALLEKDQILAELFKKVFPDRIDIKAKITMADVLKSLRAKETNQK